LKIRVTCVQSLSFNRSRDIVDKTEILRVEKYLRSLFRLDTIRVESRPNKKDSVEVMVGDEFIGVIFKDTEDGETTYHFEMAILDMDLPPASAVMKKP
jgi:hypothetical protein